MQILKHKLCCPATDVGLADLFGMGLADAGAAAGIAAEAALPEVVVSAAPFAAEAGLGLADLGTALGTAAGLGTAFTGAGGGGPVGSTAPTEPVGIAPGGDVAPPGGPASGSLLPPTTEESIQPVSSDVLGQLGVSAPDTGVGSSAVDPAAAGGPPAPVDPEIQAFMNPGDTSVGGYDATTGGAAPLTPGTQPPGIGSQLAKFFANPKNDVTAGLLGVSMMNAFRQPKLPGAANTLLGISSETAKEAQQIIAAGGAAGAGWIQQKASIDASIAQQEQQLSEQIMQTAANSGAGNQNSGLVQEQINTMRSQLETQRQELYRQAMDSNLQAAISELTAGDQGLAAIAQEQLAQQGQARTLAQQLAQLATQLNQMSVPGG